MRSIRARMTPLRQRMQEDLQLRNDSPRTLACSRRCVADFAQHVGTAPAPLGPEQVRPSQRLRIQDTQVSWTTVVQTVCALRFFSRVTLGRPTMLESIAYPRRPFTLPTILSQTEVAALRTAPRTLKHRPIRATLSATGLRGAALGQWQVTDSDSARLVLQVRQGQGQRDRLVMLSPMLLPLRRRSWQQDKPQPWLCPGTPQTRPMTTQAVSRVCRHAGQAAPRPTVLHPPVLRHAVATH
jgi:integrase/recombinase XerD